MAVNTVGTYTLFQSTLGNIDSAETNLTTEQEQLSSGNQYQNFAGMASQTQQYLSLSDNINQSTQYLADHQVIEANVNTTSSVLSQVITAANSLQTLIAGRLTGISSAGFSTELNGAWQDIVNQLNTNVGGQFLFSGSAVTTQPVNSTTFPTLQVSGTPDLGYFQGNTQSLSTRVDNNTVINYNVTAGDPAFQKIFAGLAMAQAGDANNNSDYLKQAQTLVQQGIAGVTTLQAAVGATESQLATSDTNLNNQQLYWKGLQESIGNTDIVSVSTQVAVNQGILQAAFQAFANINSLFQQLANDLKGA